MMIVMYALESLGYSIIGFVFGMMASWRWSDAT